MKTFERKVKNLIVPAVEMGSYAAGRRYSAFQSVPMFVVFLLAIAFIYVPHKFSWLQELSCRPFVRQNDFGIVWH